MGTKLQKVFESESAPTYIVAEIGVNFNGDVELARKMIDAARKAGADAVKISDIYRRIAGYPKVRLKCVTKKKLPMLRRPILK